MSLVFFRSPFSKPTRNSFNFELHLTERPSVHQAERLKLISVLLKAPVRFTPDLTHFEIPYCVQKVFHHQGVWLTIAPPVNQTVPQGMRQGSQYDIKKGKHLNVMKRNRVNDTCNNMIKDLWIQPGALWMAMGRSIGASRKVS